LLKCDSDGFFGSLGSNDIDLASLVESLSRFVALMDPEAENEEYQNITR
jgi:hypothetical protein